MNFGSFSFLRIEDPENPRIPLFLLLAYDLRQNIQFFPDICPGKNVKNVKNVKK